jgi:hypothetical protein
MITLFRPLVCVLANLELCGCSKWTLLGKARLLSAMRLLSGNKSTDASLEEVKDAYKKLVELDPAHAEYYWEELGQLQLEAVSPAALADSRVKLFF